ncbi:hypothetical protein IPF89_00885 [Candidatus Saccharibacteria bacterium]|nr:MAG: hypothetical protein IPF89_00885 [Candidatus Saccharibacteria bacterium]
MNYQLEKLDRFSYIATLRTWWTGRLSAVCKDGVVELQGMVTGWWGHSMDYDSEQ